MNTVRMYMHLAGALISDLTFSPAEEAFVKAAIAKNIPEKLIAEEVIIWRGKNITVTAP